MLIEHLLQYILLVLNCSENVIKSYDVINYINNSQISLAHLKVSQYSVCCVCIQSGAVIIFIRPRQPVSELAHPSPVFNSVDHTASTRRWRRVG